MRVILLGWIIGYSFAQGYDVQDGRSRHPSSATIEATADAASRGNGIDGLKGTCDNSWIRDLDADPMQARHRPNQRPRNVDAGHFVLVRPKPLPDPFLVAHSHELFEDLGLDIDARTVEDPQFLMTFSGNVSGGGVFDPDMTWATPYALSILATSIHRRDPGLMATGTATEEPYPSLRCSTNMGSALNFN